MTVYEVIQKLAQYEPNEKVRFCVESFGYPVEIVTGHYDDEHAIQGSIDIADEFAKDDPYICESCSYDKSHEHVVEIKLSI